MVRKVEWYFARHLFSCANAIKAYDGPLKQIARVFSTDPPLTNYGRQFMDLEAKDKKFADQLKIDGVMASSLLRAQETADHAFPPKMNPGGRIVVVPYVSEQGLGGENRSSGQRAQMEWHKRFGMGNQFDYSLMAKEMFTAEPSYKNFIRWLNVNMDTLLSKFGVDVKQDIVRLLIVSHSHTIKKFMMMDTEEEKSEDKIRHFGIVRASYGWDGEALIQDFCPVVRSFSKKSGSPCDGLVFKGYPVPPVELVQAVNGRKDCPY
jgi:broad specificity phosphatase PhoE